MFPPGENPGFQSQESTGPLPFPTCCPGLLDEALQAAAFPKAKEPGRAGQMEAITIRKAGGGGWEGSQPRGVGKEGGEPCPAQLRGLDSGDRQAKMWGSGQHRAPGWESRGSEVPHCHQDTVVLNKPRSHL